MARPTTAFRIQPRCPYQRPTHMKGHRMMPTTKPMPRPIHWKIWVKKLTIGSSMALVTPQSVQAVKARAERRLVLQICGFQNVHNMRSPGVAEAVEVLVEARFVEDVARDEVLRHEIRDQLVGEPGIGMIGPGAHDQEALARRDVLDLEMAELGDLALCG